MNTRLYTGLIFRISKKVTKKVTKKLNVSFEEINPSTTVANCQKCDDLTNFIQNLKEKQSNCHIEKDTGVPNYSLKELNT